MIIDFNGAALLPPHNDSLDDFLNFINIENANIRNLLKIIKLFILGKHLKFYYLSNKTSLTTFAAVIVETPEGS